MKLTTGVILAGGNSQRMGQNKALMELNDETVIERVLRPLRIATANVLLVTNTPQLYAHLRLPMYKDLVPGTGALGGIYTGLHYATSNAVLCVACDMPRLQSSLMNYLVSVLGNYDAVVPCIRSADSPGQSFETLCAVYTKRCTHAISQLLDEGELRVHALLDRISVRTVEPEEWTEFDPHGVSFSNLNTPLDFERVKGRLVKEKVEEI